MHTRLLAQIKDAGIAAAYHSLEPFELLELLKKLERPATSPAERRQRMEMLERALVIVERSKQPQLWAQLQGNLGIMLAENSAGDRQVQLERAVACFRAALEEFHREDNPAEWTQTKYNLANALFDLSELLGGADQLAAQIEAIACEEDARTVDPGLIRQVKHQRVTQSVGMHFFMTRMWPDAVRYLTIAYDAFNEIYPTYIRGQDREWELGETTDLSAALAYALICTNGKYAAHDAALVLEHSRARMVGKALLQQQELMAAAPRLPPGLYARFRDASNELFEFSQLGGAGPNTRASTSRLSDKELRLRPDAIFENLTAVPQESERLHAKYDQIVSEIREFLPDFGYDDGTPPAKALAIARTWLEGSESLAYLAHTSAGSVAVLVSAETIGISAVGWTDECLTTESLRELLISRRGPEPDSEVTGGLLAAQYGLGSLPKAVGTAATALGSAGGVLANLAAACRDQGVQRLVLIPGGLLGLLPVHAATLPAADSDGLRQSLLDLGPLSYAPSALVWAACRARASQANPRPGSALVVGNPIPLPPTVRPLQGAAAEARMVVEIGTQVTGTQVTPFESRAATRAAVLAALQQTGRTLTHAHFACHGQADIYQPQLSGLLLASGEQLTVRDLLKPGGAQFEQLRLCVLSACQTAIVGTDLPDEVTGLPTGWLQAGSAGVVASLWPVSDRVTLALMTKFYELHWLDQLQPGDALWLAQRWLRGLPTWRQDMNMAGASHGALGPEAADTIRELASSQAVAQRSAGQAYQVPFDSPVYWAAFVLYGS